MPGSTRFASALHICSLLAADRSRSITSKALAKNLNTNPAVVRRLLGALAKAGIAETRMGKGGGASLARGPKKITLAEIYCAVEAPGLIAKPRSAPDPDCPLGSGLTFVIAAVGGQAEQAFMAALDAVTLRQFVKDIAAANAAAKSAA